MKYIDTLLQGASMEWKPLGEVATIYGGLTGKSKADFEDGNAFFISYKNIFDNIEIDFNRLEKVKIYPSENQNKVKYGDILFTGSSETAEEAGMSSAITTDIEDNVYLNSFSFGLRFNDNIEISPDFSKYLFRSHFIRTAISKTASGVTRFNISKERFKKIPIPLPPLPVQQEIVRILDRFTTLEAELEARKKQYEYYRNELLKFENIEEMGWRKLGDLCDFQNGFAFKSTLFKDSGLPIIRITNITGSTVDCENIQFFDPADYKKENPLDYIVEKGDILIAMSGATTGKIGYYDYDEKAYLNQRVGKFIPRRELLNNRYLYHFLQTRRSLLYTYAGGGAQPNLSSNDLKNKLMIPIPYPNDTAKSLEEQARIVAILDRFDTLVNSISEGLPKEIALRRKQYEYYREQLLSFPKK